MPLPDLPLPAHFQFSQNNLGDFESCPRRFQLRHLLRLAWPAIKTEPVLEQEKALQRGQQFHQLAQQFFIGIPADTLAGQIIDSELEFWWQDFLQNPPLNFAGKCLPEYSLTTPLNDYRLIAKYDLLLARPDGSFVILDWKTNRKKPARPILENHIQTRLYRYLLVQAGAHHSPQGQVQPEQVEMVYWFTADPSQPEVFSYDAAQYHADQQWIRAQVDAVVQMANSGQPFPLTVDEHPCATCNYRSLCNRGTVAGVLPDDADMEPEDSLTIDIDQIAEIAF